MTSHIEKATGTSPWSSTTTPGSSEEEAIGFLRGRGVTDREGFVFGEIAKNGDTFDMEVIRDADGVAIGTACGKTGDEVIRQGQAIADEAEES
jgi:hypothetical protein